MRHAKPTVPKEPHPYQIAHTSIAADELSDDRAHERERERDFDGVAEIRKGVHEAHFPKDAQLRPTEEPCEVEDVGLDLREPVAALTKTGKSASRNARRTGMSRPLLNLVG